MMEAYFDESGSHNGAPILCVGGYLFEREHCASFDTEWREMLCDFQIPYFHMVDCENGNPPFDKLRRHLREAMVRRASRIINQSMSYGVVIAVNEDEYNEIMPEHPLIGSAYSFVARQTFNAIKTWAEREKYNGPISYFFEAGHSHELDADRIMQEHVRSSEVRSSVRYYKHEFLRKEEVLALQAADLLVWHYHNDWCSYLRGQGSRNSYASLIDGAAPENYWHFYWDKNLLRDQAKRINQLIEKYPEAGRSLPGDEIFSGK